LDESDCAAASTVWWENAVVNPLRTPANHRKLSVQSLVLATLESSQHIQAVSQTPLIRQQEILEAEAEFDPAAFLESKFASLNEPVGNALTTGGPLRFRDDDWQSKVGLRQKSRLGSSVELVQEFGLQDTNSRFFVPNDQGTSRVVLRFNQPLLRYGGREYNESLIVLAQVDSSIAQQRLRGDLQNHLHKVIRTYWELVRERAKAVQARRHLQRAEDILREFRGRRQFDLSTNQLMRAEAAVAVRDAARIRAEVAVRNRESQMRSMANSEQLGVYDGPELVPVEAPATSFAPPRLDDSLEQALQYRPELGEAFEQLRAAKVRCRASENELLPTLNLILESYVSGLTGNYDVFQAWANQFSEGAPSYTAGLALEFPLGNRQASAVHRKRRLEVTQRMLMLNEKLNNVAAEVRVASRTVEAAYRHLCASGRAMASTRQELDYLLKRRSELPGDDGAVSFILDDILDSQDRLMASEAAFTEAQTAYMLAQLDLQLATGTMLQPGDAPEPVTNSFK
jgi:outer membrane protein TolC